MAFMKITKNSYRKSIKDLFLIIATEPYLYTVFVIDQIYVLTGKKDTLRPYSDIPIGYSVKDIIYEITNSNTKLK